MIDKTKFPFTIDHSKCLNCQQIDRLDRDKPVDGSTWQKGVHLCSSCQWTCASIAQQVRIDNIISAELRRIEGVISEFNIYFDEVTPKQALEKLWNEAPNCPEINYAIQDLKEIIDLGYNKLRVPC